MGVAATAVAALDAPLLLPSCVVCRVLVHAGAQGAFISRTRRGCRGQPQSKARGRPRFELGGWNLRWTEREWDRV